MMELLDSIEAVNKIDDLQIARISQSVEHPPVQRLFDAFANKALGINGQ